MGTVFSIPTQNAHPQPNFRTLLDAQPATNVLGPWRATVRLIGADRSQGQKQGVITPCLVEVMRRYSNPDRNDQLQALLHRITRNRTPGPPIEAPSARFMAPDRRFSAAILDEIATAYSAGDSGRELADKYGVSRQTLIKYLRRRGVVIRPRGDTRRR